ncbi:MAG: DUF3592 domain-containing protein [Chloroflexi bacterium]|nr:DUF3592 domain-containing protein [Chloroflexota bacterium]
MIVLILLGVAMILFFGPFMFTLAVVSLIRGIRSKSWRTTDGEIVSSTVREWLSEPGGMGDFYDRGGQKCYAPEIVYRYVIGGKDYFSRRVDAREITGGDEGRKRSRRLTMKYRPGKDVRVYYNPQNPQISVLEPGLALDFIFYSELISGVVLLLTGAYFFFSIGQGSTTAWPLLVGCFVLGIVVAYILREDR